MPFYEYQCRACGAQVEVLQKINDKPLRKCGSCGRNALVKLVSAPVFRLKGGGWYETDFKSDQDRKRNLAGGDGDEQPKGDAKTDAAADAAAGAKAEPKAEAKAESKAESKSDSKPDSKPAPSSAGSASRQRAAKVSRPAVPKARARKAVRKPSKAK